MPAVIRTNSRPGPGQGERGEGESDQGTHADLRATRREWLKGLSLLVAGSTLGCSGESRFDREKFKRKLEENYGSLENPLFRARLDLRYAKLLNYRESLEARILKLSPEETTRFGEKAVALQGRAEALSAKVESMSTLADTEKSASRMFELKNEYSDLFWEISRLARGCYEAQSRILARTLKDNTESLAVVVEETKGSHKGGIAQYGSPVTFVCRLVEEITGRELPEQVRFEIRSDRHEKRLGYSVASKNLAAAHEQGYLRLVLTLCHEVGHLMALHQEQQLIGNESRMQPEQVSAWEEACAYAFEATVASYLIATNSPHAFRARVLLEAEFEDLMYQHYSGEKADTGHAEGMAILDAAYTVLGSYAAAYNYLSSHTELTVEMLKVLEENKKVATASSQLRKDPQLQHIEQKLQGLLDWRDQHERTWFPEGGEAP